MPSQADKDKQDCFLIILGIVVALGLLLILLDALASTNPLTLAAFWAALIPKLPGLAAFAIAGLFLGNVGCREKPTLVDLVTASQELSSTDGLEPPSEGELDCQGARDGLAKAQAALDHARAERDAVQVRVAAWDAQIADLQRQVDDARRRARKAKKWQFWVILGAHLDAAIARRARDRAMDDSLADRGKLSALNVKVSTLANVVQQWQDLVDKLCPTPSVNVGPGETRNRRT